MTYDLAIVPSFGIQPVFQMSVHNIVRKRKILETNFKSEEIIIFYLIFLNIIWYPRIGTVSHWAPYQNEKSATDPALFGMDISEGSSLCNVTVRS